MRKIPCCYRLEQLAYLALPDQVFIPAMLQELHHQIPALSNSFCWIDSAGNLSNIFDEKLDTQVMDEFISSLTSTENNFKTNTVSWLSQIKSVISVYDMFGKLPHLASFYKNVLIPLGYYDTYFVPVQHNEENIGILMVHRQKNEAPFDLLEREQLSNISKIIAKGMIQKSQKPVTHMDGWEQGLLAVDQQGNLLQGCTMGMKLLMLAHTDQINNSIHAHPNVGSVFTELPVLIKSLISSTDHRSQFPIQVLTTSNTWGDFILRGFLCKDCSGKHNKHISLLISKQEPFVLKLFHRIKRLGLTPRQESVGLLYASGVHNQQIADTLKLSLFTVKEHIHNLCQHLNVHSRSELIEFILCDLKLNSDTSINASEVALPS